MSSVRAASAFARQKSARLILAAALMLPACACSSMTAATGMAPIVGAPDIQNPAVTVRVMPGDTMSVISQRHGVPINAILAANGLRDPNTIRLGQTLRIPASVVEPSHMATLSPETPAQPSVAELAMRPANKIPAMSQPAAESAPLRPHAALPAKPIKPVVDKDAERELLVSARMTSLAKPQLKPQNFAVAASIATGAPKPLAKPPAGGALTGMGGPLITEKPKQFAAVDPAKPVTSETPSSAGQPDDFTATNKFIWPVSGRVLSSFGEMENGYANDGVNIEVPEGTPVKASDHGTVIYAGNQLAGFGNLLLVKHSNGYVTAYAHNKRLLVRKGDKVRQGQTIANAGRTGDVSKPQVHFEIRRGDKPVNPKTYIENANANASL
jgi:murein DD-endopeptidase MepM/ murein hydrolase activator NlpD